MSTVRLDGQLQQVPGGSSIVLLSHHLYGCPASFQAMRLASDPIQQVLVPVVRPIPFTLEPVKRGVERVHIDLVDLADGVYKAVSVRQYDWQQTVWLKVRLHQVIELTTDRVFALQWFGSCTLPFTLHCGHTEVVRVYGPPERVRQAAQQYPQVLCKHCTRATENQVAAASNRQLGCAALVGTPKQVGWAESIRWRALKDLVAWEYQWERFEATAKSYGVHPEDLDHYLFCLKVQDRAVWWIERRDLGLWALLRGLQQEGY